MRDQKFNENRKDYLLRVVVQFIHINGLVEESLVFYDGAECDGSCLADDIEIELE